VSRNAAPRGLALVLVATLVTLGLGWLLKAPCLGSWSDGRQYNRLCYSDVAALYGSGDRDRGLSEDRFPYLEGENEYPVATGIAMWVTALPADGYASFFSWTALLLGGAALATAAMLHRIAGPRALLFAAAPTLAIYAFMNWDLLAVALATAATLAFLRRRDTAAGVLIGLGAAAKLYPALLLVPFAISRLRERRGDQAARLVGWAGGCWAAVNLPFAILEFDRWSEFFRFNATRPADWDSLWYIASRQLGFTWEPAVVNGLAVLAFVAAGTALWLSSRRRLPPDRLWTFGFPLLVAFLLTSKVYSPQFGLWLLPWFALALPDVRLWAAFQVADVAVFVTRFEYFARLEGVGEGLPQWPFELAVVARAAVLIVCVVAWARRRSGREAPEPVPALAGAT
jgi:uncharacterized membrane protein